MNRRHVSGRGDPALREYLSILTELQNLPVYTERDAARVAERQREKEVARERLALPGGQTTDNFSARG